MTTFKDPTVAAWFEGCHERTKRHLCERRRNVSPCEMLLSLHEDLEYFDHGSFSDLASHQARDAVCADATRLRRIIDRGMKARARNLVERIRLKVCACDMPDICFWEHNRAVRWERRMHRWADRIAQKYLGGES